jgi:hypothetical protein
MEFAALEPTSLNTKWARRNANKLIESGYLRSETTPGIGVTYYDTGKAGLGIKIGAYEKQNKAQIKGASPTQDESQAMSERYTYNDDQCQNGISPMSECHTKKVLKKDSLSKDLNDDDDDDDQNQNFSKTIKDPLGEENLYDQLSELGKKIIGFFRDNYNPDEPITSGVLSMIENLESENVTIEDYKQGYENWKKHGDSDALNDPTSLSTWAIKASKYRMNQEKPLKRRSHQDSQKPKKTNGTSKQVPDQKLSEYIEVWKEETGKPINSPYEFEGMVREFLKEGATPLIFRKAIKQQQESKYPVTNPSSVKKWTLNLAQEIEEHVFYSPSGTKIIEFVKKNPYQRVSVTSDLVKTERTVT